MLDLIKPNSKKFRSTCKFSTIFAYSALCQNQNVAIAIECFGGDLASVDNEQVFNEESYLKLEAIINNLTGPSKDYVDIQLCLPA